MNQIVQKKQKQKLSPLQLEGAAVLAAIDNVFATISEKKLLEMFGEKEVEEYIAMCERADALRVLTVRNGAAERELAELAELTEKINGVAKEMMKKTVEENDRQERALSRMTYEDIVKSKDISPEFKNFVNSREAQSGIYVLRPADPSDLRTVPRKESERLKAVLRRRQQMKAVKS